MKNKLTLLLIAATFAAQAQMQFIAPFPGSSMQNPERNIVIRPGDLLDAASLSASQFSLVGSISGTHDFRVVLATDGKTINLNPLKPFAYNEKVTVEMKSGVRKSNGEVYSGYSFSFSTHRQYTSDEQQQMNAALEQIRQVEMGHAAQSEGAAPPAGSNFTVTINTNPQPGDVWFGNDDFGTSYYKYTIQNNGTIVYSLKGNSFWWDWRVNHNNYLTDYFGTKFEMLDSNYVQIKTMGEINGYSTDIHECQIFPDGHYFLIGDDTRIIDMTQFNSSWKKNANVTGNVIQEFDGNNNLLFEWNTFDHIIITEAPHENMASSFIDACHMNALEQDADGNLLVSCRHLDQVFKLNLTNGNFIWRLGGDSNQFTFTNDPAQFDYQHDIRRIANGDITLMDNNNWGTPNTAFAKEYSLDEVNKKATLVWSYAHPLVNGKTLTSLAMGSVQRLSNGGTLIDWGWPATTNLPGITELDPSGNIVWEMTYNNSQALFRAHRQVWTPCSRPSDSKLTSTNITDTSAKVNWNASTGAVKYNVQYRKSGTTTWKSKKISSSAVSYNITGLKKNTTYQWNVQTWCNSTGTIHSGFTAIKTFTTLASRMEEVAGNTMESLELYPNPASGNINLKWNQNSEAGQQVVIRVCDLMGRTVLTQDFESSYGENETALSVQNMSAGMYMVIIETGNQILKTKFTKE